MKKVALVGALLALTGCVRVDNYAAVVKAPAPAELAGYWQTSGPQSALVSPDAVASLIITREGDTLDCRHWQRTIARPGKLMVRGGDLYNVTDVLDTYRLKQQGSALNYDDMTFRRVEKPTTECAAFLAKEPLASQLP